MTGRGSKRAGRGYDCASWIAHHEKVARGNISDELMKEVNEEKKKWTPSKGILKYAKKLDSVQKGRTELQAAKSEKEQKTTRTKYAGTVRQESLPESKKNKVIMNYVYTVG